MENGSEGANASVLFGLPGFVVCAQTMHEGEWMLAVETIRSRSACPSCGVFGVGNGRRRVLVRDLAIAGTPVIVVWSKRTWRCCEELCERGSWSETSEQIAPRAVLSERARREICRRVGEDGHAVAQSPQRSASAGPRRWPPSATTARRGRGHAAPGRRRGLGVDETAFLAANAQHSTLFVTGIVDVRAPRLLDVVQGRSAKTLST